MSSKVMQPVAGVSRFACKSLEPWQIEFRRLQSTLSLGLCFNGKIGKKVEDMYQSNSCNTARKKNMNRAQTPSWFCQTPASVFLPLIPAKHARMLNDTIIFDFLGEQLHTKRVLKR